MNRLQMLTQEEVAQLLHSNISTITMLREMGIIVAIRTGRNYMFPQSSIEEFFELYRGLDVSNRVHAIRSKEIVEARKTQLESR